MSLTPKETIRIAKEELRAKLLNIGSDVVLPTCREFEEKTGFNVRHIHFKFVTARTIGPNGHFNYDSYLAEVDIDTE